MTRDLEVLEGDAAIEALRRKSDTGYLEPGRGVVRVDPDRWAEAQHYERKTWLECNRTVADDRNRVHAARFDGYSSLAGMRFKRAIELGCGPFTNMRLVLEVAHAAEVHLLDPLALAYAEHPLCRYRGGRLGGVASCLNLAAVRAWSSPFRQARELINSVRIGGLRGRPVRIEACPIEEFETSHAFDLAILINVIEHCRDADRVFTTVERILEPGGVFVFHGKFFASEDLGGTLETFYDSGHPIRIDLSVAERYLSLFQVILRSDHIESEHVAGVDLRQRYVYFIGRKPG